MSTSAHMARKSRGGKGEIAEILCSFPGIWGWVVAEDVTDCHKVVECYRGLFDDIVSL